MEDQRIELGTTNGNSIVDRKISELLGEVKKDIKRAIQCEGKMLAFDTIRIKSRDHHDLFFTVNVTEDGILEMELSRNNLTFIKENKAPAYVNDQKSVIISHKLELGQE